MGQFEAGTDVGTVLHPGRSSYDTATRSYKLSGSGENMWFADDDFHFLWKRVSGDVTLTADIAFPAPGGNAHRKAVLMIRQSLSADSAYADAALHGDGLTSLQARTRTGSNTHEVQANVTAPARLRLVKRGDRIFLFTAPAGEALRFAGGSVRLELQEPFYIGLGVCSHDATALETAVFANVAIEPGGDAAPGQLYSTLETISVASTDARAVYVTPGRLAAPAWTPDGASLLYARDGRLERVLSGGGAAQPVATGANAHIGGALALSPDGDKLAFADFTQEGKPVLYVAPATGGPAQRLSVPAPAWSPAWTPDGKSLLYVAERDGRVRICSLDMESGAETRLSSGEGRDEAPATSPDGAYVYFQSNRSGTWQIWRMRPDGSRPNQLTAEDGNNGAPHVSPDGQRLVFLNWDAGVEEPHDTPVTLRIMNLNDRKASVLAEFTGGMGSIESPSWSPDGKRVAFVSYQMLP
jgi:WD40 repeat protein